MYSDYADHFIRVDFRDEDRLKYRWDRSVDPTDFLRCRVGGILKRGFFLGGRHFEFLGYSNSGLKEHEVWFMSPINHFRTNTGEIVRVDGEYIRDQIGDFRGTPLMKQPSKYAARIAQAFTSTKSSTSIDRAEWEEVEDLGREPYLFTDGVGTISKDLGNRIWKELCKDGRRSNRVQPSAVSAKLTLIA
jgi:RNA-dependent RNA polymerase